MIRLEKACLSMLEFVGRRWHLPLYYWACKRGYPLRCIHVMPRWYYYALYRFAMWLVEKKRFIKAAGWIAHRVPLDLRCLLA